MKVREKTLMGGVLGAIALYAAVNLAKNYVLAPWGNLKQEIADARATRGQRQGEVNQFVKVQESWQAQTSKTLAGREDAAKQLFMEDLSGLLNRVGLNEGLRIRHQPSLKIKTTDGDVFIELPISVDVKGDLDSVVSFLTELYRRPYLVRVSKLGMSADPSTAASPAAKPTTPREPRTRRSREQTSSHPPDQAAPNPPLAEPPPVEKSKPAARQTKGPRLAVNMELTTLVLPVVPKIRSRPLSADDIQAIASDRLGDSDYSAIAATNLFRAYEPPHVEPPAVAKAPESAPAAKPTPSPQRPKMTLVGTSALNGELVVYVRNDDHREEGAKIHRVGDSLDDGSIVAISPQGMVVRTHAGGPDGNKDFFYALGKHFAERRAVTRESDPQVYEDLGSDVASSAP